MPRDADKQGTLAVGGLAAVLASACCLGPLVLVSIGLSGAWIGQLTRLEPLRPWFLLVSVIALVFAYRLIWRPALACRSDDICALPATRRAYKVLFWIIVALVVVGFGFPYVAPWFY